MKIITKNRTFLNFLISFLFLSQILAQEQPTIDQFMGVNLFWADPIEKAQCVGFVREFHDWTTDQNDSEFFGPVDGVVTQSVYPNECYTWSPTHSGVIDFDYFYNTLIEMGLVISPSMNNSIWPYAGYRDEAWPGVPENDDLDDVFTWDTVPDYGSTIIHKPVEWTWVQGLSPGDGVYALNDPSQDLTTSAPYAPRANWLYNYVARYGSGQSVTPYLQYCGTEPNTTSVGLIQYIESWNEPDKFWHKNPNEVNWAPETFFSPEEYAAMANCDYDGDEGNIVKLDINGDPIPAAPLGITRHYTQTQLDNGELRFVMGAPAIVARDEVGGNVCTPYIEDYDCSDPSTYQAFDFEGICQWNVWDDWIIPMKNHLEYLRDDDKFFFDVINVHHYSSSKDVSDDPPTYAPIWLCPEEDEMRFRMEWLYNKMVGEGWKENTDPTQNKELWLSEFGYDTGNDSENFPASVLINGLSPEDMHARWLVRSFLELAAAGVDRAVVHDLRDSAEDPNSLWDQVTGLLTNDGSPKKAWHYLYTMKNILTGFNYVDDLDSENCTFNKCDVISANECTRVYKFQNLDGETVWAVWSPTKEDITYNFNLELSTGTTAATGVRLTAGSINGIAEPLIHVTGNTFQVPVSEVPIFIIEESLTSPQCPGLAEVGVTCSSVSIDIQGLPGPTYDSYQVWYGQPAEVNDPDFSALGGEMTLFGDFSGSATSVAVTGLEPGTNYTIYVIPQTAFGIPNEFCFVNITTSTTEPICNIPLSEMAIDEIVGDGNMVDELFDEQSAMDLNGFCTSNPPQPSTPWLNFDLLENNVSQVEITLSESYIINQFYLFDIESSGLIIFQYSENGTDWFELTEYYTDAPINFSIETGKWVAVSDFEQPTNGIEYLRITATSASARLGELLICGQPVCEVLDINIQDANPDCSTVEVTVDNPNLCSDGSVTVTEQSDLSGGATAPITGNTANFPSTPLNYGDVLIPNITYYTSTNSSSQGVPFVTSNSGTGCINSVELGRPIIFGCTSQGFLVPPGYPANAKMQVWLTTVSSPFQSNEHPLVTHPDAVSQIVDINAFVGSYGYALLTGLTNGETYYGAYRYITLTESSVLHTTNDFTDFTFTVWGPVVYPGVDCGGAVSLVEDNCTITGAIKSNTLTNGQYEFSERATTSSTPTIGALATAIVEAEGADIHYEFQDTAQIKYLYWRWSDGTTTKPWEYIETDVDPCAPVVGERSETVSQQTSTKIYPNPTNSIINLICNDCIAISLYSIDGRKQAVQLIENHTGSHRFNIEHLPVGMYFLQVKNSISEVEVLRFVVQ